MKKLLAAILLSMTQLITGGGGVAAPAPEKKETGHHTHHDTDTIDIEDLIDDDAGEADPHPHWCYEDLSTWIHVSGTMQSPINVDTSLVEPMENGGDIILHCRNTTDFVENNGHTIQVWLHGAASINNRSFRPVQLHFHSMSEHTINGRYYEMEMHIVHTAQNGRLAVIGVLFSEGAHNDSFQEILDDVKISRSIGDMVSAPNIDIYQLLPTTMSYYHYLGSLTTPPLTENVEWYLLAEPVELSAAQLAEFRKYYGSNYRAVQPLNDRPVLLRL